MKSFEGESSENQKENADRNVKYSDYCIDVWAHIADFIHPEDVERFALICRCTAYITSTATFWKGMYGRHVLPELRSGANSGAEWLPRHLRPDTVLDERRGLRTRVIQSLFLTYKLFKMRLSRKFVRDYGCYEHDRRSLIMDQLSKHKFVCVNLMTSPPRRVCVRNHQTDADRPSSPASQTESLFDFQAYFPEHYIYYFQKAELASDASKHQPTYENIHRSEDIFFNMDENVLILYVKTLKNRFQKNGTSLSEMSLRSGTVRETKNRSYSRVTLEFEDRQTCGKDTHIFRDVVELRVYKWFEFNQNIRNEMEWQSISSL